jgi:hypothetical protein
VDGRHLGAVVAGGVAMIGVAASGGRLFPGLAHMGRLEGPQPEPVWGRRLLVANKHTAGADFSDRHLRA